MFTGLIAEKGIIKHVRKESGVLKIGIQAPQLCDQTLKKGDSVALNGICLTVVTITKGIFEVQAMLETMQKSTLSDWKPGRSVNLERAMCLTDRLDGHLVSGHVDGVGVVVDVKPEGSAKRIRVSTEKKLISYIAEKGSVTLDGISLTVASVASNCIFSVAVIPHTLEHTSLGMMLPGGKINIEVDIIARYVERLLVSRDSRETLTIEKLVENGFL
ncbi:riboflavin synthase [bacterium]|nr:riboflavin synthase [bacterium]